MRRKPARTCEYCEEEYSEYYYSIKYLIGHCDECGEWDFIKNRKPHHMAQQSKSFSKGHRIYTAWHEVTDGD